MKNPAFLPILIIYIFLGAHTLQAQQSLTVNLSNEPVESLFRHIENNSAYRIYSLPGEMSEINVTLSATGSPMWLLMEALKGTPYKISTYGSDIFILRDRYIATEIPESFYLTDRSRIASSAADAPISLSSDRKERAGSEFRIYAIGEPAATPKDRVTVSGTVYDFKTDKPVSGLAVMVNGTSIRTNTDSDGNYSISVPYGRQELYLSGGGQRDGKRQIQAYSDGRFDIETIELVYSVDAITVYGNQQTNINITTIGAERFRIQQINKIPTPFGETDIMRIVTTLPGVKSGGDVSSGFNVRGGATDQNLILFNDNTIYNPNHLFGLYSAFNPDAISGMELYKSSIPAKYGGRISAVLDVMGREGSKEKFAGSASIGLLTSQLTIEGPIWKDRTSFLIGGRTTYSNWLLSLMPESSGYREGNANFYDLNANLSHSFNEKNKLIVNAYYSQDKFQFKENEVYSYRNANASLKWSHIFNPDFTSSFAVGFDHYDYDMKNTVDPLKSFKLDFAIDQVFLKTDFNIQTSYSNKINFGLSSILYDLNPGSRIPSGDESLMIPVTLQKEKNLESALYVSDVWEITDNLSIDLGVRYSLYNVLGPRDYNTYDPSYLPSLNTLLESHENDGGIIKTYHGPEFRASMRYAFGSGWSIKAGANTMRQYIHKVSNNYVMSPTDTWKLSDVNIKPQTGIQYAAGLYKNFNENSIEVSLEGYYKTMNDYLDYRHGAELLVNPHLETDVVPTKGKAYGAEFMVRKKTGKLTGWVSYAYARTFLRQEDERIEVPVNDGDWYPADFDKPHEFKLVANYKFTHRYSISLNCEYSTGRPITLPISKYMYEGGQYVYYSRRNEYRIPDYFRLDVSFNIEPSHHLTVLTHSTITIGIYNVTGRKNAHSVYYLSEDGRLQGYQLSIFGAPIPYISYNIKF